MKQNKTLDIKLTIVCPMVDWICLLVLDHSYFSYITLLFRLGILNTYTYNNTHKVGLVSDRVSFDSYYSLT